MPGACKDDPDKPVLWHFSVQGVGSNRLNGDLCAGYGCSFCHSALDLYEAEDREFYMRRSQVRTLDRLVDKGLGVIA